MTRSLYTPQWRDRIRGGAVSSAGVLAPLLVEQFHPETMIDVGAGEGHFADAFGALGVHTTKVDGDWVDDVVHVDFANPPYPELPQHDLALCLEVGEHIPETYAADLVSWLCGLAPVTVFSAAIPRQGGTGHVNERWPSYWADLFAQHGRTGSGALRWDIWSDDRVEPWYRQNVLVFGSDLPADGCPSVVHPDMWSLYRR